MATPQPSIFGALLRRHRLAAGLTQGELAERAGISERGVSDLERGVTTTPRQDTVRRLADGLDLRGLERADFLRTAQDLRAPPDDRIRLLHVAQPPEAQSQEQAEPEAVESGSGNHGRAEDASIPSGPALSVPRVMRRLPLALALLVVLIALLTVVLLILRPDMQTNRPSVLDVRPVAVWGGAPPPVTLRSPSGVAVGDGGDIYVADTGDDRIVKLSPSGHLPARWGGTGAGGGTFRSPAAVAVDPSGVLYVADAGNRRIQKLSPAGAPLAQWSGLHPGFATQMGLYLRPSSVVMGTGGIVYLTDPVMDYVAGIDSVGGGERYFSFTTSGPPGGIAANVRGNLAVTIPSTGRVYFCRPDTYVGTTPPILERECHAYGHGLLQVPQGIALDAHDDMYVTDRALDRVVKVSPTGQLLSTWGVKGSGPGQFNDPVGAAVDRQGNVYVADAGNDRVQKLSPSDAPLAEWGGLQPTLPLHAPADLAVDHAGYVYAISRDGGPQLVKIAQDGVLAGGWKVEGALSGLAVGSDDTLYAVDSLNSQVVRISRTGAVLARWGKIGSGTAELNDPSAIASDDHGTLYVADSGNSRIVSFAAGSRPFGQWRQVVGPAAGLIEPTSIAVDQHGDLYVADVANHRVIAFSPQGVFSRDWSVEAPTAVAIGPNDRLYILDGHTNQVLVSTTSGRLLGTIGGRGGRPGQFRSPESLTMDQAGRVYLADTGNDRIQVFRPPG